MIVGQEYYFWDKNRNRLAAFIVVSVNKSGFYFSYRGKTYKCSHEYAKDKIFENQMDVPQYREKLERERIEHEQNAEEIEWIRRRIENRKANESYQPHGDVWVVHGD